MRQPKTDLSPKKNLWNKAATIIHQPHFVKEYSFANNCLYTGTLLLLMEVCHQVTLLFFYCWLRLSSPLLNGRCWNKLKYPFYPCQKCIHEEHWLFNAGQMWRFLWKYVFVWKGNESLGWDVLHLTSGGEEAEDCASVLRLCQWKLAFW